MRILSSFLLLFFLTSFWSLRFFSSVKSTLCSQN
jgi:hypothetical protein